MVLSVRFSSGDRALRIRLGISTVGALLALMVVAPAGAAPRFVPGELLVRFEVGAGAAVQDETVRARRARVERALPLRGLKLVRLPADTSVAEAIASFERDPDVLYAQPNHVYEVTRFPNDPGFEHLWGLHNVGQAVNGVSGIADADVDAPEAWDLTIGSANVVVAVVDTGMDYTHPDLAPNVGAVRGWDFVANDNAPLEEPGRNGDDAYGHGTHVAGTIGARGNNAIGVTGMSWNVSLMALRAADSRGVLTDDRVVAAFDYARANGARVVNGSFGGPAFSRAILDSITAAPNALFVFAAGNGDGDNDDAGDDNDAVPQYPCAYPASNIVCVAATGFTDRLADFSNFGATTVDLAAPGVDIVSTLPNGEYGIGSGTSMATPQVSGIAALVLSDNPSLSTAALRSALLAGVDRNPSLVGSLATDGRTNALRALEAARAMSAPPPPPPPPPPLVTPPAPPPPAVAPRDTVAPNTRMTRAPARRTTSRTARFRFVSSERGSTFRCKLDRRAWRACSSPKTYRNLRPGWHTVRIRARDAAGNTDATPALRRWRIV